MATKRIPKSLTPGNKKKASPPSMPKDPNTKTLVCLGAARQPDLSRHIVGKEISPQGEIGPWVRVTNDENAQGIPTQEFIFLDDKAEDRYGPQPDWKYEYQVGHILEAPLQGHVPNPFQKENWTLRKGQKLQPFASWSQDEYDLLLDPSPREIFQNGYHTQRGLNDRIPEQYAKGINHSLLFIKVDEIEVIKHPPEPQYEKGRIQGSFHYQNANYRIWIPHIETEGHFLGPQGTNPPHHLGESYLTLSLLPPFHGYCYKVIVGIFSKELPSVYNR